MDLSKVLRKKSPLGINGLKKIENSYIGRKVSERALWHLRSARLQVCLCISEVWSES